jgi:hypothetical protein
MKGLTLWEPYATLIASSVKTIETRSWGTSYRGPVAIHAAKKWDHDVMDDIEEARDNLKKCWGLQFLRLECQRILFESPPWTERLGCILAVVDLVDCRLMPEAPNAQESLFGSYGYGRWGWVFDPVTLQVLRKPIPCRGQRLLWNVPESVRELLQS